MMNILRRDFLGFFAAATVSCGSLARGHSQVSRKAEPILKLPRDPLALVLDAVTGQILMGEATAHVPCPPASLVKLMTSYIVFEELRAGRLHFNDKLTATTRSATQERNLGLRPGETLSLEQALLALNLYSANDAAVMLAEKVSGSVEAFVKRMNETAVKLGMKKTVFSNPSGLPDKRQVTTAYDIALLTKALNDESFPGAYRILQARDFTYDARPDKTAQDILRKNGCALTSRGRGLVTVVTGRHDDVFGLDLGEEAMPLVSKTGYLTPITTGGDERKLYNQAVEVVQGGKRVIAVVLAEYSREGRTKRILSLINQGLSRALSQATARAILRGNKNRLSSDLAPR